MLSDLVPCPKCHGKQCDRCHLGMVRKPVSVPADDLARLKANRNVAPLDWGAAERANESAAQARKLARARAKGTARRTISVKGATYRRVKDHCEANGKSVSGWLEELIAERLES